MVTCRQLHHVTEVSDGCLDASIELRDCSASGGENTLEDNKACFLALAPNYWVHTLVRVLGSPRLRRSTCDRRVYTSLTCFATPCDNGVPTFTRWGPCSCPVASAFSYIYPMGSRLLPGGECLLEEAPAVNSHRTAAMLRPVICRDGVIECRREIQLMDQSHSSSAAFISHLRTTHSSCCTLARASWTTRWIPEYSHRHVSRTWWCHRLSPQLLSLPAGWSLSSSQEIVFIFFLHFLSLRLCWSPRFGTCHIHGLLPPVRHLSHSIWVKLVMFGKRFLHHSASFSLTRVAGLFLLPLSTAASSPRSGSESPLDLSTAASSPRSGSESPLDLSTAASSPRSGSESPLDLSTAASSPRSGSESPLDLSSSDWKIHVITHLASVANLFRVVHARIGLEPSEIKTIVMAACVLHNMLIEEIGFSSNLWSGTSNDTQGSKWELARKPPSWQSHTTNRYEYHALTVQKHKESTWWAMSTR